MFTPTSVTRHKDTCTSHFTSVQVYIYICTSHPKHKNKILNTYWEECNSRYSCKYLISNLLGRSWTAVPYLLDHQSAHQP